jgi:hypothetical protein
VNLVVHSPSIGARMEAIFADDLRQARRLRYEPWRQRPVRGRLVELLVLPVRDLL